MFIPIQMGSAENIIMKCNKTELVVREVQGGEEMEMFSKHYWNLSPVCNFLLTTGNLRVNTKKIFVSKYQILVLKSVDSLQPQMVVMIKRCRTSKLKREIAHHRYLPNYQCTYVPTPTP